MTQRERLLEILADMPEAQKLTEMADFLLENGVVALPCKKGDTVYRKRKNSKIINQYNNVSLEWICKHIEEFGINYFTSLSDCYTEDIKCVDGNKIKAFAKERGVFIWQIAAAMGISEPTMTRKLRMGFSEEEAQKISDIINKLAEVKQK